MREARFSGSLGGNDPRARDQGIGQGGLSVIHVRDDTWNDSMTLGVFDTRRARGVRKRIEQSNNMCVHLHLTNQCLKEFRYLSLIHI